MVWRKHPEMSAYDEGALEAENWQGYVQGTYGDQAFSMLQKSATDAYAFLDHPRVQADPEHQELLHGYLSRFD